MTDSAGTLCISPLCQQAAGNMYVMEWMVGQAGWWTERRIAFWLTYRMLAATADEQAAWLPTIAMAIRAEKNYQILSLLADWELPEPVPPEAKPWEHWLSGWKPEPAIMADWGKTVALRLRVRLDRQAEHLPEWLREARRAVADSCPEFTGKQDPRRHFRLAALAGWRPQPGATLSGSTLRRWVHFWEGQRQASEVSARRLIATQALLNLTESGFRLSETVVNGLLRDLSALRSERYFFQTRCFWNIWNPTRMTVIPLERLRRMAEEWQEMTHPKFLWTEQYVAWNILLTWQRAGVLERCGMDLAPLMKTALETETDDDVIRIMSWWVPSPTEVAAHPQTMTSIADWWRDITRDEPASERRQAGWVARWNLMRAGVGSGGAASSAALAETVRADYLAAVASESDPDVLLTLAMLSPPGPFPLKTWLDRLMDWNSLCRLAARLAVQRYILKVMEGARGEGRGASGRGDRPVARTNGEWRMVQNPLFAIPYSLFPTRQYGQFPELPLRLAITRRQMRQALRRAGQEGAGNRPIAPFVNLPPEVLPDFRRLHEIETALAAGHLPPSPDAAAENRAAPRVVPARLPETQPQMNPPGITDRAAGAGPTVRHPFQETIRHE
jgi:hypothetical protein